MADTPPVKITERLLNIDTYKKYAGYVLITFILGLCLMGGVSFYRWLFPKPDKQMNNPKVVVLPGAKVDKIDQTNTQIQMSEKPWEVGLGGGGITYDNKSGVFVGGWVKRKW